MKFRTPSLLLFTEISDPPIYWDPHVTLPGSLSLKISWSEITSIEKVFQ